MRQKYYYICKILNNFFVFDKYKNNIVVCLTLDKSLGWSLIF